MSESVAIQKLDLTKDDNDNNLNSKTLPATNEDQCTPSVINHYPEIPDENSSTLHLSAWKKINRNKPILLKNRNKHGNNIATSLTTFGSNQQIEHKQRSVFNVQSSSLKNRNVSYAFSPFRKSPRAKTKLLQATAASLVKPGQNILDPKQRIKPSTLDATDSNWLISYNTSVSGPDPSFYQSNFWNIISKQGLHRSKSTLCLHSNAESSQDSKYNLESHNLSGGCTDKECGSLKPLSAEFKNDYPNLWNSCKAQSSRNLTQDLNNFTWFSGKSVIPNLISTTDLNVPNLTASAFPDEIPDLPPEKKELDVKQVDIKKRAWKNVAEIIREAREQNSGKFFMNLESEEAQHAICQIREKTEEKLSININNNNNNTDDSEKLIINEASTSQVKTIRFSPIKEEASCVSPEISSFGNVATNIPLDFYESIESLDCQKLNESDVQDSSQSSVTSDSSVEIDVGGLLIEDKAEPHDVSERSSRDAALDEMYAHAEPVAQIYSSINTYPVTEEKSRGVVGSAHPWLRYSLFPHTPPTINFRVGNTPSLAIPSEIKKILKWKSTTVTPVIIRKVLYNSGMRIVKRSQQWISVWAKHMRANMFKTIVEYQKFNHFPGTFQIGRKDTLWRNHMRLRSVHGKKSYDFVPTTYVIPADMKQLRHAWEKSGSEQMWIVKPPAAARGSGIKVIHKFVQIPKVRPLVIQKYLSSPYLINGVKFDLRIYVYVTSFYPLRIYVYKEGLARFASVLYSSSSQTVGDRYMHLTNFSINRKSGTYTANEDIDACKGHKWSLKALWGYLAEQGHDTTVIWNSMVDLVIKTIISCENTVSTLTRLNMKNPASCHELFGFDIILDSNLKPWLLEVNISPSLQSSSKLDVFIKGPMCKDLLNLSGVMIPPHLDKAFQTSFTEKASEDAGSEITNLCFDKRIFRSSLSLEERAKQAVFTRMERHEYLLTILANLTPDDIRQLVLAEDERNRAGQYICVFPTYETHKYHKFFDRARYYNHLFDAWETRYHDCRDDGIERLIEACKQGMHLKTVPRNEAMSSPKIDVEMLSSSSSLSVKCCARSTTNRAFQRACRSARSLISRMRIRRSTSRPSTPIKTAPLSSAPTLSNVDSGEPQSKSSGMSSLAVHKTDSTQTKGATSLDADHPFQNDDLYAAYTNTWQSHHCNALVKSKQTSRRSNRTNSSRQRSKKTGQRDRVYPDVRSVFPNDRTINLAANEILSNEDSSCTDE